MRPLEESEAAWVPDYFGDEYLQLYQFPAERTDPEVAFLVRELTHRIPPTGQVLDLACGQGRHAVALARQGFRVTGLDYQANLLTVAADAARAQGVAVSLVRGDMRQLPFVHAFDAVQMLFSAFGYFSDAVNARVLGEVAKALRPGGWFVLDVANRDALLRQVQPRSWKRLPDGTPVISEWTWDVATGRYTHWQMLVRPQGLREFSHSVRLYSAPELTAMLGNAGFSVEVVHGGFRGEALTMDAPRMIFIAQKCL